VNLDFSRDKRLLIPRQFKAVFDSPGGKIPGKSVLLLVRENGLDHPRIGMVIGKKSVKLSVERNRLKRLIRESFRLHQALMGGWDIVVVARKGIAESNNVEITRQFGKFWKRIQRTQNNETQPVVDSGEAQNRDA
jgi:ribonuclease P protein component